VRERRANSPNSHGCRVGPLTPERDAKRKPRVGAFQAGSEDVWSLDAPDLAGAEQHGRRVGTGGAKAHRRLSNTTAARAEARHAVASPEGVTRVPSPAG
jgi:hypothetical protein